MTKRRIFISHRRIDQKVSPTARMIANLLKKKIPRSIKRRNREMPHICISAAG